MYFNSVLHRKRERERALLSTNCYRTLSNKKSKSGEEDERAKEREKTDFLHFTPTQYNTCWATNNFSRLKCS